MINSIWQEPVLWVFSIANLITKAKTFPENIYDTDTWTLCNQQWPWSERSAAAPVFDRTGILNTAQTQCIFTIEVLVLDSCLATKITSFTIFFIKCVAFDHLPFVTTAELFICQAWHVNAVHRDVRTYLHSDIHMRGLAVTHNSLL